jgi:hypothetical protein
VDTVESAVAIAVNTWRAYGVGPADRAALADDLRLDLRDAVADGRTPADLLGPDVAAFARRLADEAGVDRLAAQNGRLLGTASVGGLLGAIVAFLLLVVVFPLIIRGSDLASNVQVPIQVAVGVFYGIPSAAVLAGAIIAVRVRLHDLPRLGSTVRAMTVLLPLTAVVITPITMGFAWTTQYSSSTPIVLIEVALVAGALAGAIVLARRWALRGRPLPAPATV